MIEVFKARPRAMRSDYLVRGVGRRAVLVVIPHYEAMKKLSQFELYWLCVRLAEIATKLGWKNITANVGYDTVRYTNASRIEPRLAGEVKTLCGTEHFLNDAYYQPEGFWIQLCGQTKPEVINVASE